MPVVAERLAQLQVIVDFSIVGDRGWTRREHRLRRRRGEVDDRQTAVNEAGGAAWTRPCAMTVGAAVRDHTVEDMQRRLESRNRRSVERNDACDTTHKSLSLLSRCVSEASAPRWRGRR